MSSPRPDGHAPSEHAHPSHTRGHDSLFDEGDWPVPRHAWRADTNPNSGGSDKKSASRLWSVAIRAGIMHSSAHRLHCRLERSILAAMFDLWLSNAQSDEIEKRIHRVKTEHGLDLSGLKLREFPKLVIHACQVYSRKNKIFSFISEMQKKEPQTVKKCTKKQHA
jgi:hypothetical protein